MIGLQRLHQIDCIFSRNILLTGDYDRFDQTNNGWHSLNVKGGVYDIRYARFENCGVQDMKGRYCSHFHLSSTCPDCKMIGNAYENAIQSSVTIHGTHRSLVDNNVMWNSRNGSSKTNFSIICSILYSRRTLSEQFAYILRMVTK